VNATANGNSVSKTSGCDGCNDAGAISQQRITAGDGFAQFTAGANGPLRIAGLTQSFSVSNPGTIAFGLRFQNTFAEVREGGGYRADTSFVAGDVFRIAVQSGVVRYSKNGTVFYTSQVAPAYPLVLAAALAGRNSTVGGAVISGAAAAGSPSAGSSFARRRNRDASSHHLEQSDQRHRRQHVADPRPRVATAASTPARSPSSRSRVGTATRSSPPALPARYGLPASPRASAWRIPPPSPSASGFRATSPRSAKGGVYRTDVVFAAGDVFRISVRSGVVSYAKNGTVFYTSGAAAGSSLALGVAIANMSGTIGNAVLASGL